ncbi:TIGR03086 family metal-binding protein [Gordonia neofelifaecis]|uniref:Mycothiol-dependent maleylpyruvate isomerase metal-binding domain-containing protein n=1 Tax=Gordonia neofelifaecis NRRL B-59395 TaxID=644548 RepID=F1YKP5_9ACTN|nr:TIGR03086 family metal-binding protein [Gordonia neofelifaecis]EGD54689.1 hypothetical protein SCNU_12392 [Gordonia neofelifaecis NRRL B-59395]
MTGLAALAPGRRHQVIAAGFAGEVTATPDWDAPAPVDGWTARDVVAHLVQWFPAFLSDGGVRFEPVTIGSDPVAAWAAHSDRVQGLFDRGDAEFSHPMVGTMPLADAVDRFYTSDVFMHTWDLAQASGRRPPLDPEYAEQLLGGLAGMEDILRSSGQYGPAFPAPADADSVVRLAAFIGRDPAFGAERQVEPTSEAEGRGVGRDQVT